MFAWIMRFAGLGYLLLGAVCAAFAVYVIILDPENYYEPPYSCASLECAHELHTADSDGHIYCSIFPPKEIKSASISGPIKRICVIGGTLLGFAGLGGSVATMVCGLLWLSGIRLPEKHRFLRLLDIRFAEQPRPWRTALYFFAPALALTLTMLVLLAGVWLQAVYGFVPR